MSLLCSQPSSSSPTLQSKSQSPYIAYQAHHPSCFPWSRKSSAHILPLAHFVPATQPSCCLELAKLLPPPQDICTCYSNWKVLQILAWFPPSLPSELDSNVTLSVWPLLITLLQPTFPTPTPCFHPLPCLFSPWHLLPSNTRHNLFCPSPHCRVLAPQGRDFRVSYIAVA